jgi:hypothetical protein
VANLSENHVALLYTGSTGRLLVGIDVFQRFEQVAHARILEGLSVTVPARAPDFLDQPAVTVAR